MCHRHVNHLATLFPTRLVAKSHQIIDPSYLFLDQQIMLTLKFYRYVKKFVVSQTHIKIEWAWLRKQWR